MDSAGRRAQESLVVELSALGSAQVSLVGGKALNLGKLAAAGFPVPDGFCLTTVAYRMAAPAGLDGLAAQLDTLVPGGSSDGTTATDRPTPGELARQARELIVSAPIPAAVDAALRAAYAAMGPSTVVAVRSSATAEDLPFASFAGQQDSFLNIAGGDAVVQSVRRCWASLWTERAVMYRFANGISQRTVSLAVVVQEFVAAAQAGVLFTANPVTGVRTETVIDASAGPGHAVVSGSVNPEHFLVESASGRILQHTTPPPNGRGPRPGLADAQAMDLTATAGSVQRLFGAPQDVEWVIDAGGKVWLTQSRPITALYPLPVTGTDGGDSRPQDGSRVYLCGTLLQGLTRPITPLGIAVLKAITDRKGKWDYAYPGLRMYIDLAPIIRNKRGRRYLLRILPLADGRAAAVISALLADPRFAVRKHQPRRTRQGRTAPETSGAGTAASLALLPGFLWALIGAAVRPRAELERAHAYQERLEAELVLPEPATAVRRLEHVRGILDPAFDGVVLTTVPGPTAGYLMLALARRLLRGIADPRELETVLRGLPHNVTTEMDLELWKLAEAIGADSAARAVFLAQNPGTLAGRYLDGLLPQAAQSGLREFLARYGHRAVAEIDPGMPRWSEQPDHILGMITNYLRVQDPEQAPDRQFARAAEHADARVRSLVERSRGRSRLRARLVQLCLSRARQLSGLRELPKFYFILVLAEMRRQLLAVGADLVRAGRINDADDIFFVDFDEARVGLRGADLHGLVAERRQVYRREMQRRRIPRILLSDGTDVEAVLLAAAPHADGALAGTPASAGTATGKVRVITDPVGARLEPGEILVVPSTDPGWTPLFLTAGALVMEMGGVISHGAVVAREYGIPAIVGVPDATTLLHTGETVVVDGAAGTVRLAGAERHAEPLVDLTPH
ncbi:MAG: PEP/pyruvate-binding domain-containing protein [Arthrobacter oryzae]